MRFVLRTRDMETEVWPDGRGIAYQPLRLIAAVGVVHEYLNENRAPPQKPKDPPGRR